MSPTEETRAGGPDGTELITLAGGCFWCTEAVFSELRGVARVEPGYSGGTVANPTYREVCTGATGHAEVVQIAFDPRVISLADLLGVFLTTHDPTTLNRQGPDEGPQYRSAIFYRTPAQQAAAERAIREVGEAGIWPGKIVTEVTPFTAFYPAEEYHREYFKHNGGQPYCRAVIAPKVAKFRKQYRDRLRAT